MTLPIITDWDAGTTLALLASMGQLLVRRRSTGKSARVEELLLLARACAAKRYIAMRETSEAPNDIGMQLCPAGEVGTTERAYERDRALLIGQIFRMLEWKIEEQALGRRDFLVEPARNCAFSHSARKRIGCESIGFATKHVARELIEHEDERERRLRRGFPVSERPGARVTPQRLEAGHDFGIERSVLFEPFVLPGGTPKGEHISCAIVIAGAHSRTFPLTMRS
jgi:hypothetical protein